MAPPVGENINLKNEPRNTDVCAGWTNIINNLYFFYFLFWDGKFVLNLQIIHAKRGSQCPSKYSILW